METPAWLDRGEYPFQPHFVDLEAGRMHYVDEGEGPVVVLVHGTPVWSFLYRDLIKTLSRTHRCIAPDHLGFGLSDKPDGWSYRPEDHARNLRALIERLDLRDITLVVHDFGGPIGLSYAVERPENVARLVVFNTWMWSLRENREAAQISRMMSGALGRFLYKRLNISPRVLIPAISGERKLPPHIHRHYIDAAPTPQARHAMWVCARELVGSSDWYDSLWTRRERIRSIPALLLWGMRDRGVQSGVFDLARWQGLFADARTVTYGDVGHFVQEEAAPQVASEISAFLQTVPA
ncbi:MAG TPA: alpha/beta fold hydrolase [Roseiflexaceae bacterium]|nr:alpha/beta fold hydrolase [Roseiflexaceae bacterium]